MAHRDALPRAHPTSARPRIGQAPDVTRIQTPYPSLRMDQGRLLLPVRVIPRARQTALSLESAGLRVHVGAPPVEGAANAALLALLAERLGMPPRNVTLARGASARHKLVAIEGLTAEDLWRRLGL